MFAGAVAAAATRGAEAVKMCPQLLHARLQLLATAPRPSPAASCPCCCASPPRRHWQCTPGAQGAVAAAGALRRAPRRHTSGASTGNSRRRSSPDFSCRLTWCSCHWSGAVALAPVTLRRPWTATTCTLPAGGRVRGRSACRPAQAIETCCGERSTGTGRMMW